MRKEISLDGIWDFYFSETDAIDTYPAKGIYTDFIMVPGCFDVLSQWAGKRGTGFFRRKVTAGGKVALSVDGLGVTGVIYWDGIPVGKCPYSYMPERFIFDAGKYAEHEIVIAVNNLHNDLHQPYFDFYAFGGIYGSVKLEELPELYVDQLQIRTLDYEKRLIRVDLALSSALRKETQVSFCFDNKVTAEKGMKGKKASFTFTLEDFALWSVDEPVLHTLTLTLDKDMIQETFGIRQITIEGTRLLLNGRKLFLKGFNRHESHPNFGAAVPPSLMTLDLHLAKNQGCNFIRGSHYPQRKSFLDLCDRMGILVWEETLGWGLKEPYLYSRSCMTAQKEQIQRMVKAHFNHPSIIIWGFLNENESRKKRTRSVISTLYKTFRQYDTSRPVTYASNKYEADVCLDLVDIIAMNPYPGWYGSTTEMIAPRLKELADNMPKDKPLIISEIGAAALYGERDPFFAHYSEDYQALLAKEVCSAVLNDPRYSGLVFWHFCDARSYLHNVGRPRGYNNKGFLDEYRREKMAWGTLKEFFKDK